MAALRGCGGSGTARRACHAQPAPWPSSSTAALYTARWRAGLGVCQGEGGRAGAGQHKHQQEDGRPQGAQHSGGRGRGGSSGAPAPGVTPM